MPTIRIKYVQSFMDRHGSERLYFRRHGFPKAALRGPKGSPEFWEDYQASARGETPPGAISITDHVTVKVASPNSLRFLCQEYRKSPAFKSLDKTTRRTRAGVIERLCERKDDNGVKHGDKPFARMARRHVIMLRDELADTPDAANHLVKVLRQIFRVALDREWVEFNPVSDIDRLKSKNPDGFHAWTLKEVELYENKHPIGTKARLALALLLYTAQRRSDIVTLGRQHEYNGRLEFTQFKGRNNKPVRLSIRILSELQRIIDASPTGDLTYLVTNFNKPFSANGFGWNFRKWCDEAGLPQCSAHGVRKASAARMAEQGCTDKEIMAYTGHKTLQEVQRYTASARQKELADSANKKLEAGQRTNKSVKPQKHGKKV
ncbi:MAG: tyrosine-type recombinase/integrase [Gammaproteobacteria bacterium]|nr:tyrosine-type recombinase/integrase [Gammaproteobacteria bacterium]